MSYFKDHFTNVLAISGHIHEDLDIGACREHVGLDHVLVEEGRVGNA